MLYVYMWRKIEFFTISPRQHASSSKQQGNSLEMMGELNMTEMMVY